MSARELTDESAPLVFAAIDRLIGDLAAAAPPLGAIGIALRSLADGLGVERVVVAVDDATLGRQVFCSDRRPLGDGGVGLFGPTGMWADPPRAIDTDAARLLDRTIGVALGRADAPTVVSVPPAPAPPASAPAVDVEDVEAVEAVEDIDVPAVRRTASDLAAMGVAGTVAAATARALRHGWGFTLVLLRGGAGLTEALRPRVRAADTLVATSDRELALLLPETAGDVVPDVLGRLAVGGGVPPFSYGLACCPADSRDATVLTRIAAERLADALRAQTLT
jgi:hypothetical protein